MRCSTWSRRSTRVQRPLRRARRGRRPRRRRPAGPPGRRAARARSTSWSTATSPRVPADALVVVAVGDPASRAGAWPTGSAAAGCGGRAGAGAPGGDGRGRRPPGRRRGAGRRRPGHDQRHHRPPRAGQRGRGRVPRLGGRRPRHAQPRACWSTARSRIGEGAFLGTGAIVTPGARSAPWAVVGAGAVVVHDVPAGRHRRSACPPAGPEPADRRSTDARQRPVVDRLDLAGSSRAAPRTAAGGRRAAPADRAGAARPGSAASVDDGVGQQVGPAHRDEPPGRRRRRPPRPAHPPRWPPRHAGGQRLHDRHRDALVVRRQHEQVGRGGDARRVGPVAEDRAPCRRGRGGRARPRSSSSSGPWPTITNRTSGRPGRHRPGRLEQVGVALRRPEVGDRDHQDLVGRRCRARPARRRGRRAARPRRRRRCRARYVRAASRWRAAIDVADLVGHGDHRVVEPEGGGVGGRVARLWDGQRLCSV